MGEILPFVGLRMMLNSGKNIFYIISTKTVKFANKNDMFCAWRDFKRKLMVGVHMDK